MCREMLEDVFMASDVRIQELFDFLLLRVLVCLHSLVAASSEKLEHMVALSKSPSTAADASTGEQRNTAESISTTTESDSVAAGAYGLLRVANLKFVASCTSFDEAAFREHLHQCKSSSYSMGSSISASISNKEALDKLVAKARQWVEDGI